ncbi:MAG: hypothetical protein KBA46_07175 [Candidatus Omnitrophica bacterium]|nr:hypothetical protein [Candidatus Omnitrophota bacterium]
MVLMLRVLSLTLSLFLMFSVGGTGESFACVSDAGMAVILMPDQINFEKMVALCDYPPDHEPLDARIAFKGHVYGISAVAVQQKELYDGIGYYVVTFQPHVVVDILDGNVGYKNIVRDELRFLAKHRLIVNVSSEEIDAISELIDREVVVFQVIRGCLHKEWVKLDDRWVDKIVPSDRTYWDAIGSTHDFFLEDKGCFDIVPSECSGSPESLFEPLATLKVPRNKK